MAQETKRGCGFRHVGGIYLVGQYISIPCDRLPFRLNVCPVCGEGIKVGRGMTEVNPLKLFGWHTDCQDKIRPCFVCDPTENIAFLMGVGERYYPTPEDFMKEGIAQGVSKRIAQIPKHFEVGKTIVYLVHPRACEVRTPVALQQAMNILESLQPPLVEAEKREKAQGIFAAFIPQRIEKLFWQSELDRMSDEEKKHLAKRGITPIGIKDGDKDHA